MADGLSKGVERDDWKGEPNTDPRSLELSGTANANELNGIDSIQKTESEAF